MTKTLVALVLIAGGILLVTRLVEYRQVCAGSTVAAYGRGPNLGSSTRVADYVSPQRLQSY